MIGFLTVLVVIAMLGTLGVLLFGVISMARGGEFNRRNSNKLMRWRIVMQMIALVLFAILMVLLGKT
ncbi:MAG: twin transmembrane helix small protein [Alphaproteobacteria bacterium]|nr:twin transmembrane helix small protein [Alphaproteobacteria bacterium]